MNDVSRTLQQNKAMHKYFRSLADALNAAGLDMKKVLKPHIDIPWTPESVKRQLWIPVQEAMLEKDSTTALETHEVDKIYKTMSRHLSEKFGVNVEFPSEGP
jgi:hypothetical protein